VQDVFDFRNRLIDEYSACSRSFSKIASPDLLQKVEVEYERGRYWPEPLIQINPNYKRSGTVQELVKQGSLHATCASLFQTGKIEGKPASASICPSDAGHRLVDGRVYGFVASPERPDWVTCPL
jgi:hypothetical protein